ncbi:MAG: strawberry notch-like NTP hydrolase domain-containing protein, partial [Sphingobium sp.]
MPGNRPVGLNCAACDTVPTLLRWGCGGDRAKTHFIRSSSMTQIFLDFADSKREADSKAASLIMIGQRLADQLASGSALSRQKLKSSMTAQFCGSDASGAWSMRDAYDAAEIAQVLLVLRDACHLTDWADRAAAFHRRTALIHQLPTQSYRSEQQVEMQQFSTPLPLAWLAACAARMKPDDLVLEPSAGTGMLAVHARQIGARLLLNERDPGRAAIIARLFEQETTTHDAEFIGDLLSAAASPNVILINPPFGRSESRGRDRFAGARHLRSALMRLAPGGRCIAIMPPGFASDGTGSKGYDAVAEIVQPRWEIMINGTPYAKHGTSISVRLLLFDKRWSGATTRFTATDLDAAFALALNAPLRLDEDGPSPELVAASRPSIRPLPSAHVPTTGLFARQAPRALMAPPARRIAASEPVPVLYQSLDAPPPAEDQIGIYVPWRLTRMAFAKPSPHPDQLVESVAMSSILPPAPSYAPLLPPQARETLSDAQLETVVFAGQAFERDIPGAYRPNEAGTLLVASAEGHVYRLGFMVGDGTGVGKGRQIAACILDQWSRGRRRALWISKSAALLEDARRDWSALGGLAIDIQPLDAFPLGDAIGMESGILFLTFATLRSQRDDSQSRLQQILAWLGPDHDGIIAFDEAHEMANAAGTETRFGTQKGSEQGLAGVRLQNLLPRARILYNSATGATDPANLCYAARLGLWGHGAFETREAFMTAIGDGGIAAMEIVARDLKAMGLYTARALTFSGVDYDPLEHVLTPEQIGIYDAYADAWALIHRHLETVLEATNVVDRMSGKTLNAQAKGAALSRFESAKQRFFGQLLIGMKLPTLIKAIERDIAEGRHAVVQLVTTSEAMLERQI